MGRGPGPQTLQYDLESEAQLLGTERLFASLAAGVATVEGEA